MGLFWLETSSCPFVYWLHEKHCKWDARIYYGSLYFPKIKITKLLFVSKMKVAVFRSLFSITFKTWVNWKLWIINRNETKIIQLNSGIADRSWDKLLMDISLLHQCIGCVSSVIYETFTRMENIRLPSRISIANFPLYRDTF